MSVLITGATGMIGRPLARRLFESGRDLVVLTRDPARARAALDFAARFESWDGVRPLSPPLEGIEAVIHLAGENLAESRWTEERKKSLYASRVESLHAVWESLRAPPRVFVSASATGFYGDRGEERLDEGSTAGTGFLARLCVDWEQALFERRGTAETRKVALRTGPVLDAEGGFLARLLPIFRLGLGGKLGSGRQWLSWIRLDDLIDMYMAALDQETWQGPINAVAPGSVRNSEFSRALAHEVGRPAFINVPAFALRAAMGELADALLASARVRPARAESLGFPFKFPGIEWALRGTNHPKDPGAKLKSA